MANDKPQRGDQILFFDVESLPCEPSDPLWIIQSARMKPRDGEDSASFASRVEEARLRTALMGGLGRPWMIGWAAGKGDPIIHMSLGKPEDEENLLKAFWESLEKVLSPDREPWWVGHNIEEFDIPFLRVRALKYGMTKLARVFGGVRDKPWERRVVDTRKLWPMTSEDFSAPRNSGLVGAGRLDTICHILGVPLQNGVMGTDVYQAWLKGDHIGVAKHLEEDVRQVREVFLKLRPLM